MSEHDHCITGMVYNKQNAISTDSSFYEHNKKKKIHKYINYFRT